ncbi:hypothetical protein [Hyphomonas sp.]|uniref:hypothetical protein n=1 Tax=Hyphomonas sp. TaxID=87 RepID=UPI00391A6C68
MTERAVKAVTPFAFRADFGPQPEDMPPADDPARVSFTGEEIAGLIAQVRAETLAEVARVKAEAESERLAKVTAEMKRALGEVVQLVSHIEGAKFDTGTEDRLRREIESIARRLIDGQGDLFAGAGQTAPDAAKEGTP